MILATHDDPEWVHEFLRILQRRKRVFVRSLAGARYDILELGGGGRLLHGDLTAHLRSSSWRPTIAS